MIIFRFGKIIINKIKSVNPFKGQHGQDIWVVVNVMKFKRNGYFVDLAAADGITNSNTFFLEKFLFWKGICIEPNPQYYKMLSSIRNCDLDNSVISDKNEEVSFRIDNGQHGGIIGDDTKNKFNSQNNKPQTIINLRAKPLSDVLFEHNAPAIIDYFSLDVEGAEGRVIRSIDFSKYKFRCLTIENPTAESHRILIDNGYTLVKVKNGDGFYVNQTVK